MQALLCAHTCKQCAGPLYKIVKYESADILQDCSLCLNGNNFLSNFLSAFKHSHSLQNLSFPQGQSTTFAFFSVQLQLLIEHLKTIIFIFIFFPFSPFTLTPL